MKVFKKLFMIKRLLQDMRIKEFPFPITSKFHSKELKEYYFLFSEDPKKLNPLISKFDDKGIPLNRTYIDVAEQRYIYFPITIGQMAIAVFHTYLKNKTENNKTRFLNFADWFVNNAEIDEQLGARWMTEVELPQYKNPGPWQSAFAQCRAISTLIRAYQITNDQKYHKTAEKALIPFTVSVSDGGVTSFTKYGPFYEEYTATEPTLVLNGMIFALLGIYDFCRAIPENETAQKLFKDGIETLQKILPEYDMGYWSKYNLCQAEWYPDVDPARISYHVMHISQLEILHQITGKEIFKRYKEIFEKQMGIVNKARMYLVKYFALKKINRI